jgi:hypothetical protein
MANKEKQEYDYEGDMAMSQLKSIIANAQRMHDMLKVDTNLPEWVQSKITLAEDYITTASNYMQGEMSEEVNIDKYADMLIKRDKQNLSKSHVVHAARVAGVDHKKLMSAVNQKVGRIKEEAQLDELSKDTMLKYLSANKKSDAAAQEKGDYSKSVKRMRGTDMAVRKYTARDAKYVRVPATEEVAVNSVGSGQVAGLQGEPPVNKKKKNVMSFNRFMKK